jgi:hypothetical protein
MFCAKICAKSRILSRLHLSGRECDSKSLATHRVLPAVCSIVLFNRLLIREVLDRKRIRGTNLAAKPVDAADKAICGYL